MRRTRPREIALPLGTLLEGALTADLKRGLALADLSLKWSEVVGPLASRSRPLRVEGELLVVVADSPALAQRLKIQAGGVARKIREGWGLSVSGLHLLVGPVTTRRRPTEPVSRPLPAPREDELARAGRTLAPYVADEEVASALARLMAVYRRRFGEIPPAAEAMHPTKE